MLDVLARRVSRLSLKVKVVGLLAAILVLILAAFTAWTYHEKLAMTESEIVEQARMLTTEMDATWSFVSANQYTINHDSTGAYDYKGLHCALAGKSVAALFSQHSDTVIRFTKLDPRNSNAEPDEFEEAALRQFEADPRDDEYYGFTEYEGRNVFRYVSEMRVTKDCTECHGEPAGEIDPTGHPKEGWKIGDVGGAMSIIVPTDLYFDNMMASVWNNVMFFLLIMLILGIAVYFALSWMVVRPLESLGASLRAVDADPSRAHTAAAPIGVFDSREMDTLFAHFDSMSSALSVLYGNLESQVGERTDQLRTAMEQLQEQRAHVERVNERLKRDNQYKTDFLAIVSHELRTPLTSIIAFADLLDAHVPRDGGESRRQLDEIEKNGQILLEMVDNVLETARIQSGRDEVSIELIDVSDLVGMVVQSLAPLASKKGIALTSDVSSEVPLVMSDWEKLRRILSNLVNNAIKFTGEGGSVAVAVARDAEEGFVHIEVRDTGIGIPADKHELIFERFTQENMSTARRFGGSGLGLSLVKDLVGILGGDVSLTSRPGEGSEFVVRVPVVTVARTGSESSEGGGS
ncbi:ATP-binding protein [Slackia exigua]|uniref:ATP-binding protein n=1 Tax=Slackia exigua TaxID=84109 RepID=UPI0023F2DE9C|nr:ATP-binding protein [Slackia exigua]